MSRTSSMARLDKGLIVQGTGYTSPFQPSTSAATQTAGTPSIIKARNGTMIRRVGSTGSLTGARTSTIRVASGGAKNVRAPFLPAGRNRKMLSAYGGGISSSNNACINTTAMASLPTSACCSNSKTTICKCQHPADISFLEELYVQNLQTQIEVLEMENSYLRNAGVSLRQEQALEHQQQHPQQQQHRRQQAVRPKSILVRNEDTNGAQGGSAYANNISSPPSQPSTIATACSDIKTVSERRASLSTRKRVEFVDACDKDDVSLPATKGQANISTPSSRYPPTTHDLQQQQLHDEDLFVRLERAIQNEVAIDEKLKAQMLENRRLHSARADDEAKWRAAEEEWTRERRALLEDNVELQRRLDELTPLIAEKEARLARLEDELERSIARTRQAETRAISVQARLEEQQREGSLLSELDSDRRLELERVREKLRRLDVELQETRHAETVAKDDLAALRQTLSDQSVELTQERAARQRLAEEKGTLTIQNTELAQRVKQLDSAVEQERANIAERERQVQEAKHMEHGLRAELRAFDHQLRQRADAQKTLKAQLRDCLAGEEKHREARHRMAKELEALQALSDSLTNENRGLREERIAIDERMHVLQNQVFAKERDVADLTERLNEFKRKYTDAIERLSSEITRQHDTSAELEEIVKRVHELSHFIPRHTSARSSSPTRTEDASSSPAVVTHKSIRKTSRDHDDAASAVEFTRSTEDISRVPSRWSDTSASGNAINVSTSPPDTRPQGTLPSNLSNDTQISTMACINGSARLRLSQLKQRRSVDAATHSTGHKRRSRNISSAFSIDSADAKNYEFTSARRSVSQNAPVQRIDDGSFSSGRSSIIEVARNGSIGDDATIMRHASPSWTKTTVAAHASTLSPTGAQRVEDNNDDSLAQRYRKKNS